MPLRRVIAALLLASLTACTTLRPIANYEQYVRNAQPGRLWVTPRDAKPVMLEGPRFVNDTLVGFVRGRYHEFAPGELSLVQVRRPAGGKTAVLVGVLAAAGISLLAILASGGEPTRIPTPEDPPTSSRP
jgi:type IV pilus biogenesis protein CpaD/CtpE